jgi:predicted nucleic acid-binding protein
VWPVTCVALDSNILVYAELEPESAKGKRAAQVIAWAAFDGVIPVQVLGEFLRVVQRRVPSAFEEAVRQAALYRETFLTPATTDAVMTEAAKLALRHRLQLWDCVVCAAAIRQGAEILLTEDLQGGGSVWNLRLLNPFSAENTSAIDAVLRR